MSDSSQGPAGDNLPQPSRKILLRVRGIPAQICGPAERGLWNVPDSEKLKPMRFHPVFHGPFGREAADNYGDHSARLELPPCKPERL